MKKTFKLITTSLGLIGLAQSVYLAYLNMPIIKCLK